MITIGHRDTPRYKRNVPGSNFSRLISLKNIPRINFILHIVKARVVSVGDDSMADFFEFLKVIYHF